tara:strand:+ start:263 stop:472 length:210 start_codon:yes stop_codon:yes gene_type:complete
MRILFWKKAKIIKYSKRNIGCLVAMSIGKTTYKGDVSPILFINLSERIFPTDFFILGCNQTIKRNRHIV